VLAIITGMRMIQSGQYENAVIAGADVISKFVLSAFNLSRRSVMEFANHLMQQEQGSI
jgi:3-oxoacyl-[acyl-carrier-protein] synthase III